MPTAPTCAVLISQDGTVRQVVLDLAQDALPSICDHLGYGKVAVVYLTDRLDLYVQRDAFLRQPVNAAANGLAAAFDPEHLPCHGPALVVGARPMTGRTVGLTGDQVRAVLAHLPAKDGATG
jgi:hypothetical protein